MKLDWERNVHYFYPRLQWRVTYHWNGYDWWAWMEEEPTKSDLTQLDQLAADAFTYKSEAL